MNAVVKGCDPLKDDLRQQAGEPYGKANHKSGYGGPRQAVSSPKARLISLHNEHPGRKGHWLQALSRPISY